MEQGASRLQELEGVIEAISRSQAMIEFSMEGEVLGANENFLRVFGYGLAEVKGRHHRLFVDEGYAQSEEYLHFWDTLRRGIFHTAEYRRLGKGGREVFIQATYNPILDTEGRPWKVIKVASDVTEQVRAKQRLERGVEEVQRVVSAAAGGDLTVEVGVEGADAIGQIGEGLRRLLRDLREKIARISGEMASLAHTAQDLTQASDQMSANSEETSAQANLVSAAASQVSANLQTVAVSTEELNASIREIASNTSTAAQVSQAAVRLALLSNENVHRLGVSSGEIGAVAKVIHAIAQQTNLLALNAAIEAARAGDAGRGFAVVANEVKELARRTAQATDDIERKIGAIQQDTRSTVSTIQEIAQIINQLGDISGVIAAAVSEQATTTTEIGRNVEDAARGSTDIAQNISGVAVAAASTMGAANQSLEAAAAVARLTATLQDLVNLFKV